MQLDQKGAQTRPTFPVSYAMAIDGRWVEEPADGVIRRDDPATGAPVAVYPAGTAEAIDAAVRAARRAFDAGDWAWLEGEARAAVLMRVADGIDARRDEMAFVESHETGKPLRQARAEIEAGAGMWRYAAGVLRALHGETFNTLGDSLLGLVLKEPIGVVAVITPWNFPFFVGAERFPFILAAGCTVVAKPSEFTSGTTLMLAEICGQAGVPPGVFNVVTGTGPMAGQALIDHPRVDMIAFTGSTATGRIVMRAAAGTVKKLSLELGGKNPVLVFADADLDAAVEGVAFGMLNNAGQACVAGSRLLVERPVAEGVCTALARYVEAIRVGDPRDPATAIGPLINQAQFDKVSGHIRRALDDGLTLLAGGQPPAAEGQGFYVAPTILRAEGMDHPICREEVFGPVLTVTPFDTLDEAAALANDTDYGLAATIWSRDLDTAVRAMRRIRAGRVWINTTMTGGPEMPIGPFKQSGLGRETGLYGLDLYAETKAVHIRLGREDARLPVGS